MNVQRPARILHVVGAMNRGGTETMLMNVYRGLRREKVQFDFVSYSHEEAHYDAEIKALGGRIIRLRKTMSIKELIWAIKTNGPYEAVHAHTLFHCGIASLAAFMCRVPVRISHAHTTADEQAGKVRKIYGKIMRSFIRIFSTNLLACSNQAGSYLFGTSRLVKQKYKHFPNVIDCARFTEADLVKTVEFQAEMGLTDHFVIGHIGRFIAAKNHLFLLAILQELIQKCPTVKLLLVGDGDLRAEIEAYAAHQGLTDYIAFAGIQNDVANALHSMDIFVFPSIYEGLGLVLLEAQASGKLCLVSEAIQPEADVGLGLIDSLPLDSGAAKWAERILALKPSDHLSKENITQAFEERKLTISNGVATLQQLYHVQGGTENETDAHCLI
ncbi:glycosyltransferase family 1 protein [Ornithinibacillus gellani]|uniref:glycosyltransferase family 1 protein n=1 Tax=Ornithinibacillus gellani TaxID=2293253 RepID=UPI0016812AC9|nr:glycosyltransferase family 1 protein [Ornithinibacillus gellani]